MKFSHNSLNGYFQAIERKRRKDQLELDAPVEPTPTYLNSILTINLCRLMAYSNLSTKSTPNFYLSLTICWPCWIFVMSSG